MLHYIPPGTSSFQLYVCAVFLYGFLSFWTMSCAKRPILSEIVRREDWASIFAVDTAFESSWAAILGANVVGMLAQLVFGYIPVEKQHVGQIPLSMRAANTQALAKGMFWTMLVPQIVCLAIWTTLHWTYPNDSDAIQ